MKNHLQARVGRKGLMAGVVLLAAHVSPALTAERTQSGPALHPAIYEQPRMRMLQRFREELVPASAPLSTAAARTQSNSTSIADMHAAELLAVRVMPLYHVVDIGTLGGDAAVAFDINDAGQVVGDAQTATGERHAFLYENGMMMDLGTLGGYSSAANAINNAGQITGSSDMPTGDIHAFLHDSGSMADLGTVTGWLSRGYDINEAGQIAGISTSPDGEYHAMLYSAAAGMKDLGTLGDSYSTGEAINEAGQVSGIYSNEYITHAYLYSSDTMVDVLPLAHSYLPPLSETINASGHVIGTTRGAAESKAFLYRDGAAVDLGTLGGTDSFANALNDASQVTGSALIAAGSQHAFLYTDGTMADLGTLGGASSVGYAINDVGEVAGTSTAADGLYQPFVYSSGVMVNLGLPGSIEGSAEAINSLGQVAGWYQLEGEYEPVYRAFIATPVALMLSRLRDKAQATDRPMKLARRVEAVQDAYAMDEPQTTCRALKSFINDVRELYGRKPTWRIAAPLIKDARTIRTAVGCP